MGSAIATVVPVFSRNGAGVLVHLPVTPGSAFFQFVRKGLVAWPAANPQQAAAGQPATAVARLRQQQRKVRVKGATELFRGQQRAKAAALGFSAVCLCVWESDSDDVNIGVYFKKD